MLDLHGLALLGADHGDGVIAVAEVGCLTAGELLYNLRAHHRLGVDRDEVVHLVAAVDVKQLAGGADAVRGVDIATVVLVVVETPVVPVAIPEVGQLVDVGTLGMKHLAEEALLCHVERGELEEVVDAVLQLHAVFARALGGIDEAPDLLHGHGGGHLDGYMLALLHGVNAHVGMGLPVGNDVDQVQVVAFCQLLPRVGAAGVGGGLGEACLTEDLLRHLHPLGTDIAECFDLHAGDMGETTHGTGTAHAEADEPYPHHGEGVGGELHHIGLSGRTCRRGGHDHAALLLRAAAGGGDGYH